MYALAVAAASACGEVNRKPFWEPLSSTRDTSTTSTKSYDATIIQPIKQVSTNVLWKVMDVRIIDGA